MVEMTIALYFVFLISYFKQQTENRQLPLPTELCISYFKLRISPIPNNKSVITIAYCDSPLRQPTANCPPPTATANCKKLLDCARSDRALYFVFCTFNSLCSLFYSLLSPISNLKSIHRLLRLQTAKSFSTALEVTVRCISYFELLTLYFQQSLLFVLFSSI